MHDVSAGCQNVAYSSESLWDFRGAAGPVLARIENMAYAWSLTATVLCFIPDGRLASFCLNITHGEKVYKGQWFQGLRNFPSFSRHTYLEHFTHATSVMPGFVSHGLHSWSLGLGRVRPFCWPWKNGSCRPLITIGRNPCSWQLVILHLGIPWQLLGTFWWNLTFCWRYNFSESMFVYLGPWNFGRHFCRWMFGTTTVQHLWAPLNGAVSGWSLSGALVSCAGCYRTLQRNRLSPASTLRNRPSWRLLLWTDLLVYMLKPEMWCWKIAVNSNQDPLWYTAALMWNLQTSGFAWKYSDSKGWGVCSCVPPNQMPADYKLSF